MNTDTPAQTPAEILPHADWCTAGRIETTAYPEHRMTTHHCVDCGAHQASDANGKALAIPAVTGALAGLRRDDSDVMRSVDRGN